MMSKENEKNCCQDREDREDRGALSTFFISFNVCVNLSPISGPIREVVDFHYESASLTLCRQLRTIVHGRTLVSISVGNSVAVARFACTVMFVVILFV